MIRKYKLKWDHNRSCSGSISVWAISMEDAVARARILIGEYYYPDVDVNEPEFTFESCELEEFYYD